MALTLKNVAGYSRDGSRTLALNYTALAPNHIARASTPVFIPPEAVNMRGYELYASPTLYSGQMVRAALKANANNTSPVTAQLYAAFYITEEKLQVIEGDAKILAPGETGDFTWKIPDTGSYPIVKVGVQLSRTQEVGGVYLDWLTWDGSPDVIFLIPEEMPRWTSHRPMWLRAWINGVDQFDPGRSQAFDLIQNDGRGLVSQGTCDWTDYTVSAPIFVYVAKAAGLGARVQGMRRYYALLLCADGKARLVKALDGETVLAETNFQLKTDHAYELKLEVMGTHLRGWIDGHAVFDVQDTDRPLEGGAVALICEDGRIHASSVSVKPLAN
jgi:hypothetical protein